MSTPKTYLNSRIGHFIVNAVMLIFVIDFIFQEYHQRCGGFPRTQQQLSCLFYMCIVYVCICRRDLGGIP